MNDSSPLVLLASLILLASAIYAVWRLVLARRARRDGEHSALARDIAPMRSHQTRDPHTGAAAPDGSRSPFGEPKQYD